MRISLATALPGIMLAVLIGCGESQPATSTVATTEAAEPAVEVANTVCPIMGNEIDLTAVSAETLVEWNGKKVAFCCPPCNDEWVKLTDAERADRLANPPSHGE